MPTGDIAHDIVNEHTAILQMMQGHSGDYYGVVYHGVHVTFCLNLTLLERSKTHGKCHTSKTVSLRILSSDE